MPCLFYFFTPHFRQLFVLVRLAMVGLALCCVAHRSSAWTGVLAWTLLGMSLAVFLGKAMAYRFSRDVPIECACVVVGVAMAVAEFIAVRIYSVRAASAEKAEEETAFYEHKKVYHQQHNVPPRRPSSRASIQSSSEYVSADEFDSDDEDDEEEEDGFANPLLVSRRPKKRPGRRTLVQMGYNDVSAEETIKIAQLKRKYTAATDVRLLKFLRARSHDLVGLFF